MPVFTSIYYMWGEDFFSTSAKICFWISHVPGKRTHFNQLCDCLFKLIKTMQYYTTTNNIPLVSDPSTALAEYFHLFPAVMNLRLLHTGYKSVINRNSD